MRSPSVTSFPRDASVRRLAILTWVVIAAALYLVFFVAREADGTLEELQNEWLTAGGDIPTLTE